MSLKHVTISKFNQLEPSSHPVIIFDSGAGAQSIYQEAIRYRPQLNYLIIADQAFFPYGSKDSKQLRDRLHQLALEFKKLEPIACIMACNTASTLALTLFREILDCPVIGTVPPIKPAAQSSKTKTIGLLATPATVQRPYIDKLISEHAKDCKVIRLGSENLARLSEEKLSGKAIDPQQLTHELGPFLEHKALDTIALGCTHYHHLVEEIQELLPACKIIDCSKAIARQFDKVCPQVNTIQTNHLSITLQ